MGQRRLFRISRLRRIQLQAARAAALARLEVGAAGAVESEGRAVRVGRWELAVWVEEAVEEDILAPGAREDRARAHSMAQAAAGADLRLEVPGAMGRHRRRSQAGAAVGEADRQLQLAAREGAIQWELRVFRAARSTAVRSSLRGAAAERGRVRLQAAQEAAG